MARIEEILESQLRTYAPLNSDVKFLPVPEYPKPAWYEAVVNACVHRSYGNGMKNIPIFVKMFDDRLVIESPGPFPPFVNPSNIYKSHHPRNPSLIDAMFYLDYCKCAHEGTIRIRDTMAGMGLPAPEFKQEDGPASVVVTLRNSIKYRRSWIDRDVSKIVSEAIAADFSEDEIRAVNLAAERGSITVSDANKLLNISWQSAKRVLFGLARKRVFQYIRFRPFKKNERDPKAFFRLRTTAPLPKGAFEQELLIPTIADTQAMHQVLDILVQQPNGLRRFEIVAKLLSANKGRVESTAKTKEILDWLLEHGEIEKHADGRYQYVPGTLGKTSLGDVWSAGKLGETGD